MKLPRRIAVLNFGGIGDEILFSPVLDALKLALPESSVTLILEKRSAGIAPLMPRCQFVGENAPDEIISVDLKDQSRLQLFFKLRQILVNGKFDAVLSSGSSPFIAAMLFSTGIPYRVGYGSKAWSKYLLSGAAPLSTQQYASPMYYSLADTFLRGLFSQEQLHQLSLDHYVPVPILAPPHLEHLEWARTAIKEVRNRSIQKIICIHPGVSLMSIQKNILKGWPATSWAEFLESACSRQPDSIFLLLGGPDDEQTIHDIRQAFQHLPWPRNLFDWYGKTRSLEQLAALIHESDMLISVDSAPLHLAVGYHKPVVAMFGPTDERKLLPSQGPYRAVTVQNLECRPCLWDRRAVSCDQPVCLNVSPSDMLDAFSQEFSKLQLGL